MNPEIKNIPTNKPSTPIVNQPGVMDEKTYQQYKQDSKKILVRSAMFPIISIAVWPIYALINGHASMVNFVIIHLAILLGGAFYIFNKRKLLAKYKIPHVYHHNTSSFSNSSICWNSTSSDIWRDNDSTAPGSLASWARERRCN